MLSTECMYHLKKKEKIFPFFSVNLKFTNSSLSSLFVKMLTTAKWMANVQSELFQLTKIKCPSTQQSIFRISLKNTACPFQAKLENFFMNCQPHVWWLAKKPLKKIANQCLKKPNKCLSTSGLRPKLTKPQRVDYYKLEDLKSRFSYRVSKSHFAKVKQLHIYPV